MNSPIPSHRRALLVIDVQRDFCEGGSLPVDGGAGVASRIAGLLRGPHGYDLVVGTRDLHVDPGAHFAPAGLAPDYAHTWPAHCVAGTRGAETHPALPTELVGAWFHKGAREAAFSGFEGVLADGMAPAFPGAGAPRLGEYLSGADISEVDICGIATDYCVRATALDACAAGFEVTLLQALCAGVAPESTKAALAELAGLGVRMR